MKQWCTSKFLYVSAVFWLKYNWWVAAWASLVEILLWLDLHRS